MKLIFEINTSHTCFIIFQNKKKYLLYELINDIIHFLKNFSKFHFDI